MDEGDYMSEETKENVVSLFDANRPKKEEKKDEELSFVEIMKRNAENHERMKKDRNKANKGVIRSYRLKR